MLIEVGIPEKSYLCWNPIAAKLALTVPNGNDIVVKLISKDNLDEANGKVVFMESTSIADNAISNKNYTPAKEINIVLPGNGDWVKFYISGDFGRASVRPNDVMISVLDSANNEIGVFTTSVRVRKNAETMSASEWKRFISSMAVLHDVENNSLHSLFAKYPIIHDGADNIAHGSRSPSFLSWHRAFLLSLEREMQNIDSFVTIPYWEYEEDSKNVFSASTMGKHSTSFDEKIEFVSEHPWQGWRLGKEKLVNNRSGDGSKGNKDVIPKEVLLDLLKDYSNFRYSIESSNHDYIHYQFRGWMKQGVSPADPIFFLLHAQVDRVWAMWQRDNKLFDSTDASAYALQGSWETANNRRNRTKGQWSNDSIWPWDGDEDSAKGHTKLSNLNWRGHEQLINFVFPFVANFAPDSAPRNADMIDYIAATGKSKSLGYCYDDVNFK